MNDARQQASQARAAMLAALGHDLRAPLARLLQQALDRGARLQRHSVAACARQQLELIDDLLEFSRLELRPPEVVAAPAYLYGWRQRLCDDGAALALLHGGRFDCAPGAALPALAVIDAQRLRQALRKLLRNALLRGGTALLRIDAAPAAPGQVALRCAVDDRGAPLTADDAASLDDPFKPSAGVNATAALGVALAAQLVRMMGAELSAVNLGAGSRYQFTLQAALAEEAEAAPPAPSHHDSEPFGRGRSVLLLERHGAMLDYVTEIVGGAEFDVHSADSVQQCLRLAAALPPGEVPLVVTADAASGIDAWELLARLDGGAPVLLHASLPPQRPSGQGGAGAFAAVLYKPAPPAALLQALRQLAGAEA